VPPAQFGWPEPEYIGPELVVDGSGNWVGDFDVAADLDEWTAYATATLSQSSGNIVVTIAADGDAADQTISGLTVGNVYNIKASITSVTGGRAFISFPGKIATRFATIPLTFDFYWVATSTTLLIRIGGDLSATEATFDNISVREINPLSVSLQMDGRMTYADGNTSVEATFLQWVADSSNRFLWRLRTDSTFGGAPYFVQIASGVQDDRLDDTYSPGINVPFNIASRHGSTFVNGAVDGVALTADTTPTALPDLSNTDLQIAQDFMGTIGTFRQFAGDIGDTGLVTATNPSTEPTLSLTFDGTGGSFYNLSWSE
jgi:hypothetical protein